MHQNVPKTIVFIMFSCQKLPKSFVFHRFFNDFREKLPKSMEISLCYIVGRLRASPSVLADARPHRSVLVVVVIVLKVRRVSIQQHVPVVIESIKHPKPHHRAETRAQRLVREGRVVQRHALVRHAAALARCADAKPARAHRQSFIRSIESRRARDERRGRGRARRARRIDRPIAVVAGRGADAPYPRAEARWERCVADRRILAPRRRRAPRAEDMVTATRRTRCEGRGFARGRGAKTRGTRGTGSERARAGGERWCEGDGDA